jgi:hypothetical protein
MEAHEIIYTTKRTGEAADWARITGRSRSLFESYSYQPRNDDNPQASGNYSPVYHYLQFLAQRAKTYRDGAIRMHQLVNAEAEEIFNGSVDAAEVAPSGIEILRKGVEVVSMTSDTDIAAMTWTELCTLDETLGLLASGVESLRAFVRVAKRRLELPQVREEIFIS